ncbi:MAG: HEAT repeat domain-containing protein [Planctomycetes bacterium]|nr:HEAT repeat domain-containing protein [Planctomycetota bacterium]
MHGHMSQFGCRRCAELGQSALLAASGWKPFQSPGAPTQWSRDRKVDVEHVKLEIRVLPDTKRIEGTVTHTVRPFLDGLTTLEFDCQELTVARVTSAKKACAFAIDAGKLRITLPAPAKKGKSFDVAIEYSGSPRRGIYFTGPDEHRPSRQIMVWTQGQDEDSRFWFPCFDFPNEKQTTEVIATVPLGMKALSNGALLWQKDDAKAGTSKWHWKLEFPHVAYLVTLVVGDFEIFETKWKGVPVTYWSPKGRMADVKRTLERTPKMLSLFSEKTGFAYPYAQYAQIFVQDFIFGGMENTSATTLTDTCIVDRDSESEVWMDGLVAHELGHQWFGDLVTCRDWSQGWLNEGFATFMETVWKRASCGADEENYYRMGEQSSYQDEDARRYRRPIVCRTWHDPIEVFDGHLYQKGACVLHMLSQELGEDLFWASIAHYLQRHQKGSVVTDDLRRAIEDTTGRNLEWFFDEWVFHGGHPDLDVSWSQEKSSLILKVRQTQKVDEMTPLFRFGVEVRVETEAGSVTRKLEITDAVHNFVIELPGGEKSKVKWVAFDPGAHLLHSGKFAQSDEQWAACIAGDSDAATRVRAARALGESATPAAVDALGKALVSDKLWFVRAEAARALGAVKSTAARDHLIGHRADNDSKVRAAVAGSLGSFRHDGTAAAALVEMLHDGERSPSTLLEAGVALGRTRHSTAHDKLVSQLSRSSWNDMARRGAAAGLGELGADDAIPVLIGELSPDRPDVLRASAAVALGKLGRDKASDKDLIREKLEEFVRGGYLRLQMSAIAALTERRDPKSLGTLHEQAARDLDGRVKRAAKLAAAFIASGQDRGDDVRKLREELDRLREDHRKVLDRVEKLERPKS